MTNYLELYDLERYLFKTVTEKFAHERFLSAFDFFCIVIWKANRAKSKVAHKLLESHATLDEAVETLTRAIAVAPSDKARYEACRAAKLRLPMISAVLTVLYPERFTVFDVRACETLEAMHVDVNEFRNLADASESNQWSGYCRYIDLVRQTSPELTELREKDRFLWACSFAKQLEAQIANGFTGKQREETEDALMVEKAPLPSAEEIFRMFDAAGGADFVLERD